MAKQQIDKLTMMANQIAQFFKSYPHHEAIAGVSEHIHAFWTPRMIQVLQAQMRDVPHLSPLVVEALSTDPTAKNPAAKSAHGPGKLGELGAVDAG